MTGRNNRGDRRRDGRHQGDGQGSKLRAPVAVGSDAAHQQAADGHGQAKR
jgi:hypothetical protein